jgi:hypothetical protein
MGARARGWDRHFSTLQASFLGFGTLTLLGLGTEVKLEVGLKGEDTGGKESLSGRRFERRGIADAESIYGDYDILAFLLEALRLICKAGSKVVEEAGLWC